MTEEGGWAPTGDLRAGLATMPMDPITRILCTSDVAGHPSPAQVRGWTLADVASMLVLDETEREAARAHRARMRRAR